MKWHDIYWHVLNNRRDFYSSYKPIHLQGNIVECVVISPFEYNVVKVKFYTTGTYWKIIDTADLILLHQQVIDYKEKDGGKEQ